MALDAAARLLRAPDPFVRFFTAWMCGAIDDPQVVEALCGAAEDPDEEVRDMAVSSLTRMRPCLPALAGRVVPILQERRQAGREAIARLKAEYR